MGATVRAAIPYPAGTAANNVPADMASLAQRVDDAFPMGGQGLLSARVATPHQREMYWATDDRGGKLYWGDGAAWNEIGPSPVTGPLTGFTGLITGSPSNTAADTVLGVRGKTSQTGFLFAAQDSIATDLMHVASDGSVVVKQGGAFSLRGASVTNRVVYQDSTFVYLGSFDDSTLPAAVRAQGSDAARFYSGGSGSGVRVVGQDSYFGRGAYGTTNVPRLHVGDLGTATNSYLKSERLDGGTANLVYGTAGTAGRHIWQNGLGSDVMDVGYYGDLVIRTQVTSGFTPLTVVAPASMGPDLISASVGGVDKFRVLPDGSLNLAGGLTLAGAISGSSATFSGSVTAATAAISGSLSSGAASVSTLTASSTIGTSGNIGAGTYFGPGPSGPAVIMGDGGIKYKLVTTYVTNVFFDATRFAGISSSIFAGSHSGVLDFRPIECHFEYTDGGGTHQAAPLNVNAWNVAAIQVWQENPGIGGVPNLASSTVNVYITALVAMS